MFDSVVPFKAILGTCLIFVAFIVTFIGLVVTVNSDSGMSWFLLPLLTGLGFAVIRCIQNIREIVKLKDDEANEEDKKVILKTCPEYWVKDTVIVKKDDDEQQVTICKNYHNFNSSGNDNEYHYVGGSGDTFGKTHANGERDNEGNLIVEFDGVLTTLNGKHKEQDTTGTTNEKFTTQETTDATTLLPAERRPTQQDKDDSYTFTKHDDTGSTVIEKDLTTSGEQKPGPIAFHPQKLDSEPSCVVYGSDGSDGSSTHAHLAKCDFMGPHDKETTDHTSGAIVTGFGQDTEFQHGMWHRHITKPTDSSFSTREGEGYMKNWINPTPEDMTKIGVTKGVEINLDRLNEAENVCELAKNFYWTEAYNKCKFNGVWNTN